MFGEREIIIFINHGGCFICGCYAIINNSFLFWMLNAVYKETERHPGQRSELPDIAWTSAPYFEPGNFLRSTSLVLMSTLSLLKKRGFFYRTLQKSFLFCDSWPSSSFPSVTHDVRSLASASLDLVHSHVAHSNASSLCPHIFPSATW